MSVAAQEYTYKPMLEEGKVWNFEIIHTYPLEEGKLQLVRNYSYTINGDVVDNDWLKVYKTFDNEGYDEEYFMEDSYLVAKEVDKVIMEAYPSIIYPEDPITSFYTLLDFNLHKGDKRLRDNCDLEFPSYLYVIDEDYINVKGNTYRRLYIDVDDDGITDDYWVEGIGSKKYTHVYIEVYPTGGYYWWGSPSLQSVYKDGVCIFERADFDAPGSATGIDETISSNREPASGIYDLQGRKLNSEPERGIYIKNGRKVAK